MEDVYLFVNGIYPLLGYEIGAKIEDNNSDDFVQNQKHWSVLYQG